MSMGEGANVEINVKTNSDAAQRKLDATNKKVKQIEESSKKGSAGLKDLIKAGVIGGAVGGVVAGAVQNNPVISGVMDLLGNVVGAAILPLVMELLPLIKALTPLIDSLVSMLVPVLKDIIAVITPFLPSKPDPKLSANENAVKGAVQATVTATAAGAAIGGYAGGPYGAAVGGGIGFAATAPAATYLTMGAIMSDTSQVPNGQQAPSFPPGTIFAPNTDSHRFQNVDMTPTTKIDAAKFAIRTG
jgi:uncharacterized membrane protein YeaQ/YmgE (transglycosylase-associated protein family)